MATSDFRASSTWQLQDAKAQLSALVRQAQSRGPQMISVHGKPAVVVLSQVEYRKLQARSKKQSFTALMRTSPLAGLDLRIARSDSLTRDIALEE